jgi:hypothetical protein
MTIIEAGSSTDAVSPSLYTVGTALSLGRAAKLHPQGTNNHGITGMPNVC